MITRREFITGASASVALQFSSISKKDKQILQRRFNPVCKLGEIYRIVWGNFPGFDFPDWQEYLVYCFGFQLACYCEHVSSDYKSSLAPGELLYSFQLVSHLHDFYYYPVYLFDSDLKKLVLFELFTS